MDATDAITYADVVAAAARLDGIAVRTPVLTSDAIDERVGAKVFLKAENLQRAGAFKFRGAYNSISALDKAQRGRGVVAYSSGNHARAVATAATMLDTSSVIVMPSDAPAGKLAATRAAGAEIVLHDRYTEDREEIAAAIAEESGRATIPPYDLPEVMAGQGTTALEFFAQVPNVDALVVCLGGGGLLAGCATVAAEISPATRLFGVEPEAGDDHRRSRAAGERISIAVPRTIADGQQTPAPGLLTWPINNRLVEDFPTVTDAEILTAMRVLFDAVNVVVEPSGASAFAAVLAGRVPRAARIGVTLSGGNIDLDLFLELMAAAPTQ